MGKTPDIAGADARVQILVNQVGYDLGDMKRFLLQADYELPDDDTSFQLVDEKGVVPYTGKLGAVAPFPAWGTWYRVGDFTKSETPGTYKVRLTMNGEKLESFPFEVGKDLIVLRTAGFARQHFYCQRCGSEVPGWHPICHLDDGIAEDGKHFDFVGGWHDAGGARKYDWSITQTMETLARYADSPLTRMEDTSQCRGKLPNALEEALWGAVYCRKVIDPATGRIRGTFARPGFTDNKIGTKDDRKISLTFEGHRDEKKTCSNANIAGAFALLYKLTGDGSFLDDADKMWTLLKNDKVTTWRQGNGMMGADLWLYSVTRDEKYAHHAHMMAGELLKLQGEDGEWTSPARWSMNRSTGRGVIPQALLHYALMFPEGPRSSKIEAALVRFVDHIEKCAQNPFRFPQHDEETLIATKSGWHVAPNGAYAATAAAMLMIEKLIPSEKERTAPLARSIIDWLLGVNPMGVCQIRGLGSRSAPVAYYHPIQRPIDGALILGYLPRWKTRPLAVNPPVVNLDLKNPIRWPLYQTNENWLPYQCQYMNVLMALADRADEPAL